MDTHTHLAFEKCLLIEWAWSVSQSVRLAAITRRTSFLVTAQNGKIHRLFGACCAVAFLCGTSFVGKCYEPDIISKWYSGTIRSSLAPHQYFNIGLQNLLNISLELIRLDGFDAKYFKANWIDLLHFSMLPEPTCILLIYANSWYPFSLFRCFCGCKRFVLTSRLAHISLFRIGALYL